MKKLVDTLKNIWKIHELRDRILLTLVLLFVYRFGAHVVLPGADPAALNSAAGNNSNDLLGLINAFTGGAFKQASIFALGVMPYITASIIVQLLGFAVPYFQKLQQKEGESGRNRITQITRFLTVAITLVQGFLYLGYIKSQGAIAGNVTPEIFWITNSIMLSAGTMFAMWLGEKITDKGIGNGISLLIMIGIISRLPAAFGFEFAAKMEEGGPFMFIIELALIFIVILATVMIVQGVRKIPIQFANRMVGRSSSNMPISGKRDYIPIKVNAAGVMPIIFAQALMFIPGYIAQYLFGGDSPGGGAIGALNDFSSVPYNAIYFTVIVIFTYIYTALIVNPTQYADYLKKQNAYIPGIKPGKRTAEFIDKVVSRITLPGSIILGFIAILPAFAIQIGINKQFAMFFGGTSLLIMVGVVLDTLSQIESYLLMRKYDGLVKSGKIKGRSGGGMQTIGSGM